jgi:hypothetical protein
MVPILAHLGNSAFPLALAQGYVFDFIRFAGVFIFGRVQD